MKKITSIISETIIIIFITLLFFLALELFSRILINLISKNKDIYFYGFNKKINIQIFDLSDLKINILNTEFQINKTKKIEKKKILIRQFGFLVDRHQTLHAGILTTPHGLSSYQIIQGQTSLISQNLGEIQIFQLKFYKVNSKKMV